VGIPECVKCPNEDIVCLICRPECSYEHELYKYASMRNLGVKTITGSGPRAVAPSKWALKDGGDADGLPAVNATVSIW
jgi:hypothetical protein